MTHAQRAAQIWAVLALAAKNRQILTYGMLAKLVGLPPAALGSGLHLIQDYCQQHKLRPLTSLVVQQATGLPGDGYEGAGAAQFAQEVQSVFEYDWLEHGNPNQDAFV